MRSHPAPFTGAMIRALLDGRKTQTRRPITPRNCLVDGRTPATDPACTGAFPNLDFSEAAPDSGPSPAGNPGPYWHVPDRVHGTTHRVYPRWRPGDRLWVRERARVFRLWPDPPRAVICYEADWTTAWVPWPDRLKPVRLNRCIPNGCHREAARIWREVTGVRVERVGDISEEDAIAEGPPPNWTYDLTGWDPTEHGYLTAAGLRHVQRHPGNDCDEDGTVPGTGDPAYVFTARESFLSLWTSIYGPDAGWCFAYNLKPAEAPHE